MQLFLFLSYHLPESAFLSWFLYWRSRLKFICRSFLRGQTLVYLLIVSGTISLISMSSMNRWDSWIIIEFDDFRNILNNKLFLIDGYHQLFGRSNCSFEQFLTRNLWGRRQFLLLIQNMGRTGKRPTCVISFYFFRFVGGGLHHRMWRCLADARLGLFFALRQSRMRPMKVDTRLFLWRHEVNAHLRNKLTRCYCRLSKILVLHVALTLSLARIRP